MKYSELASAANNQRQRSLFSILAAALVAAKESKSEVFVIRAPIYVDEFAEGVHVYAPKGAHELIYRKREGIEWNIEAVVSASGSVFYTDVSDALFVLSHTNLQGRKIDIELVGTEAQ